MNLDLHRRVVGDSQHRIADAELRSRRDKGALDPHGARERAVGRAVIDDCDAALSCAKLGVKARDRGSVSRMSCPRRYRS